MRIWIGNLIRNFGEWIMPDYWKCTCCDNIEFKEREIICWICGLGEMIYKGEL